MRKLVVLLVCLMVFLSCLNKVDKGQVESLSLRKIEIDIEKGETSIEEIVDNLEIIPFDFTKESILSDISKVEYFKGRYYVLDNAQRNIKIFGNKGEYVNSINKHGKGPGEYIFLSDFTIQTDKEQLVLSAQEKNSLLFFNLLGDHVFDKEMDRSVMLLSCIQFFGNKFFYFSHNPKHGSLDQLHISDEKFKIQNGQFPSDIKSSTVLTFNAFSVSDNVVKFHYPHEAVVYELKDNSEFQPIYEFDFGKYQLPAQAFELLKKEPNDEADIMALNNAIAGFVVVGKVIPLNDYIYVDFVQMFQKKAFIVNCKTGEYINIEKRIHGLNIRNVVGSINNSNTLLVALDPAEYYKSFKDGNLTLEAVERKVEENIDEDITANNPWLLKLCLK